MRYSFFILLIVGLGSGWSTLAAQPSYVVLETPKWLLQNQHNSYTVNIIGSDTDEVVDVWVAKMVAAGGTKIEGVKHEVLGYKNVVLPSISKEPLQVYFRSYTDIEIASTHLTVWFRTKDSFISSSKMPMVSKAIHRLLIHFSFDMEDVVISKDIKAADELKAKELFPTSKPKPKH